MRIKYKYAIALFTNILLFTLLSSIDSSAQIQEDTLAAARIVATQKGNYLQKGKELRTEVITTAGLHKMACCNLAESFENSSSVTVGYSDATTGARQIKLLGLSGTYTQMLDETRPIMRLFSAPWGLSFIPGSWMESIQIAKGSTSVINGAESITGQINIEHKKPTDEKPLFINASFMSDTRSDLNIISSLQLSPTVSTSIMTHADANFDSHDSNHDGFMDEPLSKQFSFANRWLYFIDKTKLQWGIRAIYDKREGGMRHYKKDTFTFGNDMPWGTDITNKNLNGYIKLGHFLNEAETSSIALIADYTFQKSDDYFGAKSYNGESHSGYFNLLYRNEFSENHDLTVGVSGNTDGISHKLVRNLPQALLGVNGFDTHKNLYNTGIYAEYTYKLGEKFSTIIGLREDWYNNDQFEFIPRLTLKYAPSQYVVIRANGGRGIRFSNPLSDNIGVLSTSKSFIGTIDNLYKEDAFTYGGNLTFYLPTEKKESTYLSFDFFRSQFRNQLMVDYEASDPSSISFYESVGKNYTNNYQVDFYTEPFDGFSLNATYRYTDAQMRTKGSNGTITKTSRPLMSRYKAILNLQYKTNMGKWIFDFTTAYNGSARVYDFMKNMEDMHGNRLYKNGKTPAYAMLYAQITRKFRGFDLYIGCENITNYKQKVVVIGSPEMNTFDASAVWGPIMGRRFDIGLRLTIWKSR